MRKYQGKALVKRVVAVAMTAALVTGLIGCGAKEKSENPEINVGYFNNVTHAQALYMKAEGTLEKALDGKASVKWTSFNAGPSEVEALFSGDIDIGYIGPVPAISANVKSDGDVVILSAASQAVPSWLKHLVQISNRSKTWTEKRWRYHRSEIPSICVC